MDIMKLNVYNALFKRSLIIQYGNYPLKAQVRGHSFSNFFTRFSFFANHKVEEEYSEAGYGAK